MSEKEKVLGFREFDLENICGLSAITDKTGDWWGMDTNLGDLPNHIRKYLVPVRLCSESVSLEWLEKELKKEIAILELKKQKTKKYSQAMWYLAKIHALKKLLSAAKKEAGKKHECFRNSVKDFEEGRYTTISAEESDEEFLRKLKEDN